MTCQGAVRERVERSLHILCSFPLLLSFHINSCQLTTTVYPILQLLIEGNSVMPGKTKSKKKSAKQAAASAAAPTAGHTKEGQGEAVSGRA